METTEKLACARSLLGRRASAITFPAGTLVVLTALTLSGCTTSPAPGHGTQALTAAAVKLVRFDSCSDALQNLRAAAGSAVNATSGVNQAPRAGAASSAGGSQAASSVPRSYSGTNTATPGVDEPDLVKTDGQLIVTVSGGWLRVVDVQTRQLTGVLDLSSGAQYGGLTPASLLLEGNHALVLFSSVPYELGGPAASPGTVMQIEGPRLVLVDLSTGTPTIISQYTIDGSLLDARQVGSVARVIIQSAPRFYPLRYGQSGQPGAAGLNSAATRSGISQWLPRYSVTTGAVTRNGLVDCASVSHPAAASYSGNSMLTVLTFDLSASSLGNGEPVTVVADGDTVYSDGASLYIASREWPAQPQLGTSGVGTTGAGASAGSPGYTAIYKFDISGGGRPLYEASGSVPGWLLGSSGTAEYSLSAWNGALRVATTTYGTFTAGYQEGSLSAVYVLEQSGDQLVIVGKAGELGAGEQIYAVRFAGPVGFVETFRQTDPLYTLDLSDPAQPRVVGQLPLSGYSSYLYPIDASHLIGVGQSVTASGETAGTQISLFDVSDLAAPIRLATYDLQFGHSEAEFDPHAFLYWPSTRLLVLPVQLPDGTTPQPTPTGGTGEPPAAYSPVSEAIVLHVGDHGFTELGTITHPATGFYPAGGQIRRSLIVGSGLWTLSDAGLKANDSTTLAPMAWVPFGPVP